MKREHPHFQREGAAARGVLGGAPTQAEPSMHAPVTARVFERQQQRQFLRYHHDEDNMLVLQGRLPPEVGAVLVKALGIAKEMVGGEGEAEPGQLVCDALGEVAGAGLAERAGKARNSDYQVLVHVDEAVLRDGDEQGRCEIEGVGVSGETARRIACDAPVIEVHEGVCGEHRGCAQEEKGCKLQLGRSRRRAGAVLERAVRVRDEGVCQFPGCESRGYLHLHHIEHWADGGGTDLENLTTLCSFHHRAVHEGGLKMTREEGELCFFSPAGYRLHGQPKVVALEGEPAEAMVEAQDGLGITAETGRAGWDGFFPVDYAGAVGHLLELGSSPWVGGERTRGEGAGVGRGRGRGKGRGCC